MFLTINGERHYRWRATDQDGHILDILVQRLGDMTAATKFFRKLLKGLMYVLPVAVTDQLRSYRSLGHNQRFLSACGPDTSYFRPRRHLFSAREYRIEILQKFQTWREIRGIAMAT